MRKQYLFFSSLLILSTLLCGCSKKPQKIFKEKFGDEEIFKIMESDYYNQLYKKKHADGTCLKDDIIVDYYYGEYRGAYVVQFSDIYTTGFMWFTMRSYVFFDDVEISFYDGGYEYDMPFVWYNHTFRYIDEAIEDGLLIKEDIENMKEHSGQQIYTIIK